MGHEPEKVACQLPINLRKEETKPVALTNYERRMERSFSFPIGQVVIIFKCQLVLTMFLLLLSERIQLIIHVT